METLRYIRKVETNVLKVIKEAMEYIFSNNGSNFYKKTESYRFDPKSLGMQTQNLSYLERGPR